MSKHSSTSQNKNIETMPASAVKKSFQNHDDPLIDYCSKLTVKLNPLQLELQNETLKNAERSGMLGAPEVLTIGSHFLKTINAKRALDIGTFTGASALAWALALPKDGQVFPFDISFANFKKHGLPILRKSPENLEKIETVEGPALDSLPHQLRRWTSHCFQTMKN